jgi:hypothetical protein
MILISKQNNNDDKGVYSIHTLYYFKQARRSETVYLKSEMKFKLAFHTAGGFNTLFSDDTHTIMERKCKLN